MTACATFYVVVGGNDIWWRVDSPAKVVGANVCTISEEDANKAFTEPNEDTPFPWHLTEEGAAYPKHEGTAVWTRPCSVRAHHALAMRAQGIRAVAEVDDNYLSDPFLNIFMRINRYGAEQRAKHLKTMGCMDGVIFSTKWLRDEYHRAFKKELRHVPELYVARNHVDEDEWPEPVPPRTDGKLRIGWMGSKQHYRDLKLAYGALAWASEQGHEIIIMGLDPRDLRDSSGGTWDVPITHVDWVEPALYHRRALPFDIGICPLERNRHTLGKSDCKALEYGVSGAAVIASASTVYDDAVKHGETGLLASSPEQFWLRMQELCNDSALRERLAQNMAQYIREERTIQGQKHEWETAIGSN